MLTTVQMIKCFPWLCGILVAALGASFGSFAGLIIYRWPLGISIVMPGSFCKDCKKKLKPWQNIPVLSWLFLRGKCGFCQVFFGLRPLVLELLLMLCALAIYGQVGFSLGLIDKFGFAFLLICLAYIDLDTFYLPSGLLIALIGWGACFSLIYYLVPSLFTPPLKPLSFFSFMVFNDVRIFSLSDRLWGGIVGFGSFSLINLLGTVILRRTKRLGPEQWAMGFGDSLLLMAIGLVVGLSHLVLVIFLASFLGSMAGILMRCRENARGLPSDLAPGAMPYGPFLAIAGIYAYLC